MKVSYRILPYKKYIYIYIEYDNNPPLRKKCKNWFCIENYIVIILTAHGAYDSFYLVHTFKTRVP